MKTKHLALWITALFAVFLLVYSDVAAEEGAKTVIGPRNVYLADGASALLAGDAEEGVELTLRGLETALGSRERNMALANLCAGYLLLDQLTVALGYCNDVLEEDPENWRSYTNRALVYLQLGRYEESEVDIRRAQALQPRSKHLKIARGMLLDKTHPVREHIEIDERRNPGETSNEEDKPN